jgi:hypothetical protein
MGDSDKKFQFCIFYTISWSGSASGSDPDSGFSNSRDPHPDSAKYLEAGSETLKHGSGADNHCSFCVSYRGLHGRELHVSSLGGRVLGSHTASDTLWNVASSEQNTSLNIETYITISVGDPDPEKCGSRYGSFPFLKKFEHKIIN